MDVEIRNFQSIEHVRLTIEGFTALVGPSNTGKSSILRAIKAALTGATGTNFVRHNPTCPRYTKKAKTCKCKTSVHLTAEGFDLLWEKGDAINRYVFNGAVHDRVERGVPDFLSPAFDLIKVGQKQVSVQMAEQHRPLFLLDQEGGTVADVLSDVANLDQINQAIRLAEKDRKEAAAQRKVREGDVRTLTATVEGYRGLGGLSGDVRALVTRERACRTLASRVDLLGAMATRHETLEARIERLSPVASLAPLDPVPLRRASQRFDRLATWEASASRLEAKVAVASPVLRLRAPDPTALRLASERYFRFPRWFQAMTALRAVFTRTDKVKTLPELKRESLAAAWSR